MNEAGVLHCYIEMRELIFSLLGVVVEEESSVQQSTARALADH